MRSSVNVSIWSEPAAIDMQTLVLKEIDLRGSIAYANDHPATIRLVQEGRVDLPPFITARIPLDRLVDDGFDTLITTTTPQSRFSSTPDVAGAATAQTRW